MSIEGLRFEVKLKLVEVGGRVGERWVLKLKSTGFGGAKDGEWCRGEGRLNEEKDEVKPRGGEGIEVGSWVGESAMGQLGIGGGVPMAGVSRPLPSLEEGRERGMDTCGGSLLSRFESIQRAPLSVGCRSTWRLLETGQDLSRVRVGDGAAGEAADPEFLCFAYLSPVAQH